VTTLSGQDILDRIRVRLGSLANVFTTDQLLSFAEDGMQEVWAVIKSFDQDYFGDQSQNTDSTAEDTYFATLSTSTRDYELPQGCREVRGIQCLTSGFEYIRFFQVPFESNDFQRARRAATASGSNHAGGEYHFTVFGTRLVLAEFPEANVDIQLWYIKSLNKLAVDTVISDILYPFSGKIVEYAVQKATASAREAEMTVVWQQQWKQSVVTLGESTGPRASVTPMFIDDYFGT